MDAILIARLLLPAWLLCGLLVWVGVVTLTLYARPMKWYAYCFSVALCFCPAALAGAQEIFWFCVVSVAMATGLIFATDRLFASRAPAIQPPITNRISILALMAATALVGIAVAVGLATPALDLKSWGALASMSVAATGCIGSAYFLKHSTLRHRCRIPLCVVIALVPAVAPVCFDQLYTSIAYGDSWPRYTGMFSMVVDGDLAQLMWLAIGGATALTLCTWYARERRIGRFVGGIALSAALILFLVVTATLCWPKPAMPTIAGENSMPQVVSLSKKIASSDFERLENKYNSIGDIPLDQRVEALEAIAEELDALIVAADKELWSDLGDGSWDSLGIDSVTWIRSAVRALAARAREEVYYDDQPAAANSYAAILRIAQGIERNGLWIHRLVGIAISGVATYEIYSERRYLSSATRQRLARLLSKPPEPIQRVHDRERTWIIKSGWHSHVCLLLSEFTTGDLSLDPDETVEQAYLRDLATRRLLAIQLMIDDFVEQHGSAPVRLDQLDAFDAGVFIDPFSASGQPFRYGTTEQNIKLYSVGPDGIDNGGENFLTDFIGSKEGLDFELSSLLETPASLE